MAHNTILHMKLISDIWHHPANRDRRVAALAHAFIFQVRKRFSVPGKLDLYGFELSGLQHICIYILGHLKKIEKKEQFIV